MTSIPQQLIGPKNCGDCAYTVEEQKVIDKFKTEYRMQMSRQHWANIFQSKILPAIYNYWADIGNTLENKDQSQPI